MKNYKQHTIAFYEQFPKSHIVLCRNNDKKEPTQLKRYHNATNKKTGKSIYSWKRPVSMSEVQTYPSEELFGLVPHSLSLAVLDVDHGDATTLIEKYPPLCTVETRRKGGLHLYYYCSDELGNSDWKALGCSGEVRCAKGYVVLWDAEKLLHALTTTDDIAEFPFPTELTIKHDNPNGDTTPITITTIDEGLVALGETHEGTRNDVYCYVIGTLARLGYSRKDLQPIKDLYREMVAGTSDESQVESTFESAFNWGSEIYLERQQQQDNNILTEIDCAELLRNECGRDIRLIGDRDFLTHYDETIGRWCVEKPICRSVIRNWATAIGQREFDIVFDRYRQSLAKDNDKSKKLRSFKRDWCRPQTTDRIYQLYRDHYGAESLMCANDFDTENFLLGLPNGDTLEITDTGYVQRKSKRSDYLTKSIPYMPDLGQPCCFIDFLHDRLPDEATRNYFLDFWAYEFIGDRSAHKALVLLGEKGTGKSTMIDLMQRIIGNQYSANLAPSRLDRKAVGGHLHWLAHYIGCRVVFVDDAGKTFNWRQEELMTLIAGGQLEANRMRENTISFRSTATMVLTGNYKPHSIEQISGMWRRYVFIHIDKPIEKFDLQLMDKLVREAPQILNLVLGRFSIGGIKRLLERVANPPFGITDFGNEIRQTADNFGNHVEEILQQNAQEFELDYSQENRIVWAKDLRDRCIEQSSNHMFRGMSQRVFNDKLRSSFGNEINNKRERLKDQNGNWYFDIRLVFPREFWGDNDGAF